MFPKNGTAATTKHAQKTILIADADSMYRRLYKEVLGKRFPSYTFYAVENGLQALQFVSTNRTSLIITCLMMHKMNGFEMIEYLVEREMHIPVLIMAQQVKQPCLKGYWRDKLDWIKENMDPDELGMIGKVTTIVELSVEIIRLCGKK